MHQEAIGVVPREEDVADDSKHALLFESEVFRSNHGRVDEVEPQRILPSHPNPSKIKQEKWRNNNNNETRKIQSQKKEKKKTKKKEKNPISIFKNGR